MPTWVKEPPEPARSGTRGNYDWDRIVADLKEREGEWLLIDDTANRSLATAIRNKKMSALKRSPGWVFLVRTRNNNTAAGTAEVYMSAKREEPANG